MVLNENWFTEGRIDFEMQQYRLLAYLQEVEKRFSETKLYPQLADLIAHYRNLLAFRETKSALAAHFPATLRSVDVSAQRLVWERVLSDDASMQELEDIVGYALTQIKPAIETGGSIYDEVERNLAIEPVGVLPLYKAEGYLMVKTDHSAPTRVYQYAVTLFEQDRTQYRGVRLEYVDSWTSSVVHTAEAIKRAVVRTRPDLPQPAVYRVEAVRGAVPLDETLLPIAKRLLARQVG